MILKDKWIVLKSMPSKRSKLTARAYNDNIYIFRVNYTYLE
jgi:hypothetical protein